MKRNHQELNPETLAHQWSLLEITFITAKVFSLSPWFFPFRVFHVSSVFVIAFCDLIILTLLFWCKDWFLRNLPTTFGAFIERLNPHSRSLAIQHHTLSSKQPRTTDMAPLRKSVTQAIIAAPPIWREAKNNEASEHADRRPNLPDVHISDAEDSHSNTILPLRVQDVKPET